MYEIVHTLPCGKVHKRAALGLRNAREKLRAALAAAKKQGGTVVVLDGKGNVVNI
jgi:hypothetical protein